MKITPPPPRNTRYKCIGWNTQTWLSGTNSCRTHTIIRTFNPAENHFLLSDRFARAWVSGWRRQRVKWCGGKSGEEEAAGGAHTEKLLINRVTVMIPPNEENVNAYFSIHLATKYVRRWGRQECPRSQIPSQQRPAGLLTSINPLDIL